MKSDVSLEIQGADGWRQAFEDNPDVMFNIIRDLAKIIQSGDRTGKTGRRPGPKEMSFDALWAMLFPDRFTDLPFKEALTVVMAGRSGRHFCRQLPFSPTALRYYANGQRPLTAEVLEHVAAAGNVSPAFFAEWRAMKLGQLVTEVLAADPKLSAEFVKRLSREVG